MIYFAPKSIRPERVEIITILSGGDTTWPVYFAAFLFFFFIFYGLSLLFIFFTKFAEYQSTNTLFLTYAFIHSLTHSLIHSLIFEPPDIMNLCAAITNHVMDEVTTMYAVADGLETRLASEYDNGRLLKMCSSCVGRRPEYQMNERWSETGDRYMLKLFRNYLFHQVDEEGAPVTDVGHMVHSLNKLDAGDPEQMLLASPDGESVLVVASRT